jgi:predicted PurR-regulated permease PerM
MMETLRAYIPARYRTRILRITGKIDTAVAHFFRGRLLICVISGVIYVTGLKLSGIDFWLLIGIAGGILSFIPFLGVVLPIIPACILAVLTVHPWLSLLGVLMTFSCVQWVIEPLAGTWILSQEVKLHPVTILLAMLIGGTLFGAFGIILSVPLAATVKILGEEFILPPLRELAHPAPVDSMHREADKTSS